MGVRIYLEGYELDTITDTDVDFTFSIADLSDIEKRNTSFSKTLVLPNTPTNQKLFGSIFNISIQNDYYSFDKNVLGNFNPSKVSNCQIYLDGIKIFDGVLRLIKISNNNGNITYETNVFGKLNDILASIGDKTLDEIDWSDYNHGYSMAEITDSWSRTEWIEGEDNYVYPLVDYGLTADGVTYPLQNFRPSLFIREVLARIFKESGFKIIAPFFDTEFFKKLILIPAEKTMTRLLTALLDAKLINLITTNLAGDTSIDCEVPFDYPDIVDGFTTEPGTGDFIDFYTGFKWQEPNPNSVTINSTYSFTSTYNIAGNFLYTFSLRKNGIAIASQTFTSGYTTLGQSQTFDFTINKSVSIVLNDLIDFKLNISVIDSPAFAIDVDLDFTLDSGITINSLVPLSSDILENQQIDFRFAVPKSIKQRDFLKSIITMFNLYVTPDKLQDKVLEFIPHTLFYRNKKNLALDWTYKVDTSQNIDITPLSEMTAREYRIGYNDDTDYWSTFYKAKFNQSYGESRITIDNDFELDTKTIKVIFGCPVMREEITGRRMIHIYKVENNVKVRDNFKPRIANWLPNVSTTSWNIAGNTSTTSHIVYPYAGHLDNPDEPTSDLLFGIPKEVYFNITTYPQANLYTAFYDALITAISNKDSRLITANMYLNPIDILNLDFRDIIRIGNHYYELHKIEKYNPINNGTCSVNLFKILGDVNALVYDPAFLLNEDSTLLLQENGIDKFYI